MESVCDEILGIVPVNNSGEIKDEIVTNICLTLRQIKRGTLTEVSDFYQNTQGRPFLQKISIEKFYAKKIVDWVVCLNQDILNLIIKEGNQSTIIQPLWTYDEGLEDVCLTAKRLSLEEEEFKENVADSDLKRLNALVNFLFQSKTFLSRDTEITNIKKNIICNSDAEVYPKIIEFLTNYLTFDDSVIEYMTSSIKHCLINALILVLSDKMSNFLDVINPSEVKDLAAANRFAMFCYDAATFRLGKELYNRNSQFKTILYNFSLKFNFVSNPNHTFTEEQINSMQAFIEIQKPGCNLFPSIMYSNCNERLYIKKNLQLLRDAILPSEDNAVILKILLGEKEIFNALEETAKMLYNSMSYVPTDQLIRIAMPFIEGLKH